MSATTFLTSLFPTSRGENNSNSGISSALATATTAATISYDPALAGDDPELAAQLAEAAAAGIPITEDLIVDFQLKQFPPYESLASQEEWSPKADHWLQWMGDSTNGPSRTSNNINNINNNNNNNGEGGGDVGVLAYQSDLFDDDEGEDEERFDEGMPRPRKKGFEGDGTNGEGRPNDDPIWDEDEQYLWKIKPQKTETPAKSARLLSSKTSLPEKNGRYQGFKVPSSFILGRKTSPSKLSSDSIIVPGSSSSTASSSTSLWVLDGDKQHWMPDDLCKTCYACEAPFSLIRRRHHCRSCGQVFCNACSSFVLNKHRVCKLCHDHHSQQQQQHQEQGAKLQQQAMTQPPPPPLGIASGAAATTTTNTNSTEAGDLAAKTSEAKSVVAKPPGPDALTLSSFNRNVVLAKPVPSKQESWKDHTAVPVSGKTELDPVVVQGHRFTGQCAATHLEYLAHNLLHLHAPLLFSTVGHNNNNNNNSNSSNNNVDAWVHTLLTLATKCCATVSPNVKKGDLLDIRPYVKIKCIPGGSYRDCAYLSGVMFRKTVTHKRMAKEIVNPKLLLVAGGIEFTRNENHRIASLETLFEQEDAYTEILIAKMIKIKPDIIMAGKAVSRKAQELLLKAGVVLIQHVKTNLLARIARQTGASILTNHVNQFGPNVLGHCCRFRLVTFRDNEIWNDEELPRRLLADPKLANHKRQEALAAKKLGENVVDGAEAIKRGLAKRGVAHTYVLLEGCPKHLGCTVVLRGADQGTLKQVKTVFRFLAGAAYSMRLETTFLRERGVRLDPKLKVLPQHVYSTSLAVDYGRPPTERRIKPWNGGLEQTHKSDSTELSAFDHQAILITSVWMTDRTQCCPAEVKGICYYSLQDVALGQFLRDSCFNLSLKCQNPNCKKSVLDHSLSFVHNDGLINIMVEEMDLPLQENETDDDRETETLKQDDDAPDKPIATWSYCHKCEKIVSPLTYISDNTWKFSFGKFLEVNFYNRDTIVNSPKCRCNAQTSSVLFFGCGKLAARFTYERIAPYGVFVKKTLPLDYHVHYQEAMSQLDLISAESRNLFSNFKQHIENISLEARSLFNSAMNRPEHLQTVFKELGALASECDHTSRILQTKILAVVNNFVDDDKAAAKTLFRFPLVARRYLYNVATVWNEKLSAAGQAITAMKKIAAASASFQDGALAPNVPPNINESLNEELAEGMRRLSKLIDYYQRHNITDITQVIPSSVHGPAEAPAEGEFDEYFDDPDSSIDFTDDVDADVLASRRRLKHSQGGSQLNSEKPTKVLGTRRSITDAGEVRSLKSTPGGAVKSAFSRLFNRGGRSSDRYIVDLGLFSEGRPRLAPGRDGVIVPVVDNQLSSIIAYSLASADYAKQIRHFKKASSVDSSLSADSSSDNPFSPNQRQSSTSDAGGAERSVERQMLNRNKSHIKHTFRDFDSKGQITCKFVCTTYWATQFSAVRRCFLSSSPNERGSTIEDEVEECYIQSLSSADTWAASGGKSGASFARTSDNRFVIKCISRTELQMFLDCAPAYFEYLSKAFFHGLPTVLCKIVGVYQIGSHNLETGKRNMDQIAVMQNMFYKKKISMIFDLKGSLRGRYAAPKEPADEVEESDPDDNEDNNKAGGKNGDINDDNSLLLDVVHRSTPTKAGPSTLLDGDFLDFTSGRPMPLTDRAKAVFQMSILNVRAIVQQNTPSAGAANNLAHTQSNHLPQDTLFLSIINVLDYSILVGIDEENQELVVGIIDFMRQYDILKQMERVGKSLPMVVGSEAPTIIQPPLYKARFTNAMERYFMTVPSRWTTI